MAGRFQHLHLWHDGSLGGLPSGGTPAVNVQPAAGTAGIATLETGDDFAGVVHLEIDADATSGSLAQVVFSTPLSAPPRAVVLGDSPIAVYPAVPLSELGFSIEAASAPAQGVYSIAYLVVP